MKKLMNEDGYTLTGVVMVLLVLSVLGISIITISFNTLNVSTQERSSVSAYYIAEAGIRLKMGEIKDLFNSESSDQIESQFDSLVNTETVYSGFENGFNNEAEARVLIRKEEDSQRYIIESRGMINGEDIRTLEKKFQLENETFLEYDNILLDKALYTREIVEIKNNGEVDSINYAGNNFQEIRRKYRNHTKDGDLGQIDDIPDLPFPVYPTNFPKEIFVIRNNHINLEDSIEFTDDKIRIYSDTTINIGNEDKEMVVNDLELSGPLNIRGNGNLTIYVKGNLEPKHGSINTCSSPGCGENTVDIFVKGTEEIVFQTGNETVDASIYAENANVRFQGNAAKLNGLLILPNGHLEVKNGLINGAVIANSIAIGNNGRIRYNEEFIRNSTISRITRELNHLTLDDTQPIIEK